jgi:hypothetical protein
MERRMIMRSSAQSCSLAYVRITSRTLSAVEGASPAALTRITSR